LDLVGRIGLQRASGLHNRAVASATAQVARQSLVRGVGVHAFALRQGALVKRKQAHDKTGRAKTALRAVAIHQAALHRVQLSVGLGQVSGSPQGPSVDGVGGLDATVDGPVLQLIPHRLGHHHRASATVTRSAAFFGGAEA
jgi:hypothetical protein